MAEADAGEESRGGRRAAPGCAPGLLGALGPCRGPVRRVSVQQSERCSRAERRGVRRAWRGRGVRECGGAAAASAAEAVASSSANVHPAVRLGVNLPARHSHAGFPPLAGPWRSPCGADDEDRRVRPLQDLRLDGQLPSWNGHGLLRQRGVRQGPR